MAKCDVPNCEESIQYLPFVCKYCGGTFCKAHRLPENHNCTFELKPKTTSAATVRPIPNIPPGSQSPPEVPPIYRRETVRPQRVEQPRITRTQRPPRQINMNAPFISPSNSITCTYIIMALNGIFFVLGLFYSYIWLNINYLFPPYYYFQTLITSLFIPGDIQQFTGFISLIFSELVYYSIGRAIEMRFGPKFLITLYIFSGLITEVFILLLQLLGITNIISIFDPGVGDLAAYLTPNWGIFIGMIAFFAFLAGPETRMTFLLFFFPVSLKAKHIIYILVGLNLIFGIIDLFSGGLGPAYAVGSFASIAGVLAAKLFFNMVRGRIINRWAQ